MGKLSEGRRWGRAKERGRGGANRSLLFILLKGYYNFFYSRVAQYVIDWWGGGHK